MLLSIYTFVKNGIKQDYHVAEMLRHHLPLADEIIVNEGYSTDGTYERISAISPKIKIFRSEWGKADSFNWFLHFKNEARRRCTGDWCILLDCDEFVPEWEFEKLRQTLASTRATMLPMSLTNFYGSYKVYHRRPEKVNWPARKMTVHRNLPEVEVWGDGSNVRVRGKELDWGDPRDDFSCHHFGFVRHPARLREKWRNLQGGLHTGKRKRINLPSFVFNWCPHDWKDPQFLGDLLAYEGPYIQAVRENPDEFVRDGHCLYNYLRRDEVVPCQVREVVA